MTPPPLAVCLGDSCIDAYLPPIDRRYIGGNAINAAVAIDAAGCPSAYAGYVGSDSWGEAITHSLATRGIDISHALMHPGPTRQVYTRLGPGGQPRYLHEMIAPRVPFLPGDTMLAWARAQTLVHLNWLSDPEVTLDGLAGASDLIVSLDFGDHLSREAIEKMLPQVDLAFFALPESRSAEARELAREMLADGPRLVVVTMGKAGSLAAAPEGIFTQPAVPAQIVDTLGAGDAFIGTFLAGRLRGEPIPACLAAAAQAAARACAFHGGWPGAEIIRPEG